MFGEGCQSQLVIQALTRVKMQMPYQFACFLQGMLGLPDGGLSRFTRLLGDLVQLLVQVGLHEP